MSDQVRDMTKGSPAKLILLFAVPLMLGNIFQQLYTMVDTIVVGQVAGFSILISQHYGARKWNDLKKAVAHSYLLTAVTAVSLLIVSQLAARWILVLLNTPDNIIGMSLIYLRIVFCGIPIVAACSWQQPNASDRYAHCFCYQCGPGSCFCCRASLGCSRCCSCYGYCSGFFCSVLFRCGEKNRYCTYFQK